MNIERNKVTGNYLCSDIVNNHLVHMVYMGYSKREATRRFRAHCNKLRRQSNG